MIVEHFAYRRENRPLQIEFFELNKLWRSEPFHHIIGVLSTVEHTWVGRGDVSCYDIARRLARAERATTRSSAIASFDCIGLRSASALW